MSDILRIRTLTDRFFDGKTTVEEEQELYDYYRREQALPSDLVQLRQLFLDFAAVQFSDEQAEQQAPTPRRWLRWAVAACAALTIAAGAAVWLNSGQQGDDECVAYIYGERITDRDVVLGEMQKTMAAVADDGSDEVEEQLKMMFGNDQ
jgi:ferric-dicitrate binding protein FerR (iron transport regulator)